MRPCRNGLTITRMKADYWDAVPLEMRTKIRANSQRLAAAAPPISPQGLARLRALLQPVKHHDTRNSDTGRSSTSG